MPGFGIDNKEWLSNPKRVNALLPSNVDVKGLIDTGGQGAVFYGTVDGDDAAIKVYYPGQLYKRIEREINALKMIESPSIVKYLWDGNIKFSNQELPVVATRLEEGKSLNTLIGERKLNHDELGIIAFDVASAIEAIWEKRIVHRDIKPSNIIIKPDGRACVIDLGLARHLEYSTITALGASWGTLGYLSPEQTRAVHQLTCKSDLYALGIVLIESAIGEHPTRRDQLRLSSRAFHDNLPDELDTWAHSAMVKTLLHPRPTMRPLPTSVINMLKEYSPKEPREEE